MNTTASITIKVAIFAVIAIIGIIYTFNKSPVEDLGSYEKQEMVKPNRGKSVIDQLFSPSSDKRGSDSSDSSDDDMSLTGKSGRYDEVRIGKEIDE